MTIFQVLISLVYFWWGVASVHKYAVYWDNIKPTNCIIWPTWWFDFQWSTSCSVWYKLLLEQSNLIPIFYSLHVQVKEAYAPSVTTVQKAASYPLPVRKEATMMWPVKLFALCVHLATIAWQMPQITIAHHAHQVRKLFGNYWMANATNYDSSLYLPD